MAGQQNNHPTTPLGGVSAFQCRSCGGQVQLRAPGQTLSAVCDHCGAVADLSDPNFRVISEAHRRRPFEPVIPIGRRGVLEGKEWECIGAVLRQSAGEDYFWQEYLLFNPWHGFRFLVNNNRHWSLIHMLIDHPTGVNHQGLKFEGKTYKRFGSGDAVVAGVLGEFYWQVHYGDTAQTADYTAPPHMLSVEVEEGGMIWSQGVYLEPREVKEAFSLENDLPRNLAPGMNQPNPYRDSARVMVPVGIVALVVLIILQFVLASPKGESVVFAATIDRKTPTDTIISKPFVLPDANGNVEVRTRATALQNAWYEVDGYLHNVETLENYGVGMSLEYYSGVDSDGAWSEGSNNSWKVLNNVPGGRYELVASISGDSTVPVDIEVARHVPIYSNFLIALGLILLVPAAVFGLYKHFESSRWSQSY